MIKLKYKLKKLDKISRGACIYMWTISSSFSYILFHFWLKLLQALLSTVLSEALCAPNLTSL